MKLNRGSGAGRIRHLPAESRLRALPIAVLTPHLAGASKPTALKAAEFDAAAVGRYLKGEPLQLCANPAEAVTRVS